MQMLFYRRTHTFTHKRFYTQTLLHTDVFPHRSFYIQKLLHTDAFTHRPFYTQTLLHTNTFTHIRLYAFTHGRFYTQTLLHTDAFTHRRFYTQTLLHTDAFTLRHFYTQKTRNALFHLASSRSYWSHVLQGLPLVHAGLTFKLPHPLHQKRIVFVQKLFEHIARRQIHYPQIFQLGWPWQHHIHSQTIVRLTHPGWFGHESKQPLSRSDALQTVVRENVTRCQWQLFAMNLHKLIASNRKIPGLITCNGTQPNVSLRSTAIWQFNGTIFRVIDLDQDGQRLILQHDTSTAVWNYRFLRVQLNGANNDRQLSTQHRHVQNATNTRCHPFIQRANAHEILRSCHVHNL